MALPLKWLLALFVLIVAMTAFAVWLLHSRNRPSHTIQSLAVLPLENLSGDASQSYFAEV